MDIKATSLDFTPMHEQMAAYVDQNILSCCATLIMKGQEIIDYKTFGYMDLESKEPLRSDAIYRMYSNTKLVTSVALMMLYEEGLFDLDDPLAKYMPQFDGLSVLKPDAKTAEDTVEAQQLILIRHILSHSAGFSYGFIEPNQLSTKPTCKAD